MPKRILTGKIVSNKMQKTVVVAVTSIKAHPKYKKRLKSTKKYQAHYEGEMLSIGDTVTIEESKPISFGSLILKPLSEGGWMIFNSFN